MFLLGLYGCWLHIKRQHPSRIDPPEALAAHLSGLCCFFMQTSQEILRDSSFSGFRLKKQTEPVITNELLVWTRFASSMSAAETNKWFLLDGSSGGHLISKRTCIYRCTPCILEEICQFSFHFSHVHVGTFLTIFYTEEEPLQHLSNSKQRSRS